MRVWVVTYPPTGSPMAIFESEEMAWAFVGLRDWKVTKWAVLPEVAE